MYAVAGVMHFVKPKMYIAIIPKYFPRKKLLNIFVGLAELVIAFGLLFQSTRNFAIYSLIIMLSIFMTVHLDMLNGKKKSKGIPRWILILRIPLQFLLIWWAYIYII